MAEFTVVLPCKVGDFVYGIRKHNKGGRRVILGKVTEMYFTEGMTLCIVVKGAARGEWGKAIFPTREAAEEYLRRGANNVG